MTTRNQLVGDVPVSRYEYEDALVLAADVGLGETAVDVVGDTVIVVDGDEQHELTLPEGTGSDAQALIRNGVLTIEVKR